MEIIRTGNTTPYFSKGVSAPKTDENAKTAVSYQDIGQLFGEDELKTTSSLDSKQSKIPPAKTQVAGSRLQRHLQGEDKTAPYYHLSQNGIIEYNGVTYVCDTEHNQLHLGDTTDKENTLTIPLSGGGSLLVNRDNIDDLAKSISMFSPEDVNLIMRALAQDAKVRQMQEEMEDEECAVGEEITENSQTMEEENTASVSGEETLGLNTASEEGQWKSDVYRSQSKYTILDIGIHNGSARLKF